MLVYHCTRRKHLPSIQKEGIRPPSYWGHMGTALSYYGAWNDAVILAVDTEDHEFTVNMDNAELCKQNSYIEQLPDPSDVLAGLRFFKGVVCHQTILKFRIVEEKELDYLYSESLQALS